MDAPGKNLPHEIRNGDDRHMYPAVAGAIRTCPPEDAIISRSPYTLMPMDSMAMPMISMESGWSTRRTSTNS